MRIAVGEAWTVYEASPRLMADLRDQNDRLSETGPDALRWRCYRIAAGRNRDPCRVGAAQSVIMEGSAGGHSLRACAILQLGKYL